MDFKIFQPSEKLSDFINYYWILEPSSKNEELKAERVIPAGYLQMFFHYKTPFLIDGDAQPSSYFCGQITKYKDVFPNRNTGMIAVVFHPYSTKAIVHLNIHELTNKSVDLVNIYSPEVIKTLNNSLKDSSSYKSKIELIEQFLLSNFFISNKYQYELIKQAVQLINASNGIVYSN